MGKRQKKKKAIVATYLKLKETNILTATFKRIINKPVSNNLVPLQIKFKIIFFNTFFSENTMLFLHIRQHQPGKSMNTANLFCSFYRNGLYSRLNSAISKFQQIKHSTTR
jgi:hypothetical protein